MARLLVLLAGLCGGAAFVLPLFTVASTQNEASLTVSTLNVWQGAESLRNRVKGEDVKLTDAQIDDMEEGWKKVRWTFVAVVGGPAALLLLCALLGMARFGRGLAALALIGGLAGLGAWAIMRSALEESSKKAESYTTTPGIAVMLLLAVGVLGTLGALVGLVRPERKADAA